MKPIRVLVAVEDESIRDALVQALDERPELLLVGAAQNGAEALHMAYNRRPQVAVCDMAAPKSGSFSILEQLSCMDASVRPQMIALTSLFHDENLAYAAELGVTHYSLKPIETERLVREILLTMNHGGGVPGAAAPSAMQPAYPTAMIPTTAMSSAAPMVPTTPMMSAATMSPTAPMASTATMVPTAAIPPTAQAAPSRSVPSPFTEQHIARMLLDIGIPAHLMGYRYLIFAIQQALEDPDCLFPITKRLYPAIAERFRTTASCVERAIRHTIHVTMTYRGAEAFNRALKINYMADYDTMTNRELIALLCEHVRLGMLKKQERDVNSLNMQWYDDGL